MHVFPRFEGDPFKLVADWEVKPPREELDRVARQIKLAYGRLWESYGVTDQLGQIGTPTCIIVGDQDAATVPAKAERIHAGIPNSKLVVIRGAGHTSKVEEPVAVTAAMAEFLPGLEG